MEFTKDDIIYFLNLFKGREDVFALRWEKGSKGGYMPAYSYDPYHYRLKTVAKVFGFYFIDIQVFNLFLVDFRYI